MRGQRKVGSVLGHGPIGEVVIPEAEAKVIAAMAEGKDPITAAREAGYTMNDQNSRALANELWKRHVSANDTMLNAMAEVGITPITVATKMKNMMEAQNTIVTKGGIMDVPDNTTQIKALDMVMKVTGAYAPKATVQADVKFEHFLLEIENE